MGRGARAIYYVVVVVVVVADDGGVGMSHVVHRRQCAAGSAPVEKTSQQTALQFKHHARLAGVRLSRRTLEPTPRVVEN